MPTVLDEEKPAAKPAESPKPAAASAAPTTTKPTAPAEAKPKKLGKPKPKGKPAAKKKRAAKPAPKAKPAKKAKSTKRGGFHPRKPATQMKGDAHIMSVHVPVELLKKLDKANKGGPRSPFVVGLLRKALK